MTDLQLIEQIRNSVAESVTAAFNELGIATKVRNNPESPFKRVEQLLWNYKSFGKIIIEKRSQIDELTMYGLPKRSTSALDGMPHGSGVKETCTEEEIVQGVVDALEADIVWVHQVLQRIDLALDTVRGHDDFQMMCEYYFDGCTLEQLATKYHIDRKTVASRKNNLVRQIALNLFTKDSLDDLVGDIV